MPRLLNVPQLEGFRNRNGQRAFYGRKPSFELILTYVHYDFGVHFSWAINKCTGSSFLKFFLFLFFARRLRLILKLFAPFRRASKPMISHHSSFSRAESSLLSKATPSRRIKKKGYNEFKPRAMRNANHFIAKKRRESAKSSWTSRRGTTTSPAALRKLRALTIGRLPTVSLVSLIK